MSKMRPITPFRLAAAALGALLLAAASPSAPQAAPAGKEMVYVFNLGSQDVSVIDPAARKVVRTHPLGVSVRWLSNEQNYWDGARIWTYTVEKGVSHAVVIDPRGFRVVKKIPLGAGPSHSAVLVRGNRFALVNVAGENHIAVIDTAKLEVVRRIPTGAFPCDLDTTPDGRYLFTPERDQDTVARFDLRDFSLAGRLALEAGSRPHMLRVSPDGRRVWVQNARAGTNTFLGADPFRVEKTLRLDSVPVTNAFSPDGRFSYVTNMAGGTVSVVDRRSLKEVTRLTVGRAPANVGFTSDGRFAYVSVTGRSAVAVIDARTHRLVDVIPVGRAPSGLLITSRF
ncbi:MAG: cytochrome D1 domain-containing protein [bacterium]